MNRQCKSTGYTKCETRRTCYRVDGSVILSILHELRLSGSGTDSLRFRCRISFFSHANVRMQALDKT